MIICNKERRRSMTQYIARDLVKKLRDTGFVEVNIVGDHHIYKNMINGKRVSIPYARRKDTVAIGTAHQILSIIKECENNNK